MSVRVGGCKLDHTGGGGAPGGGRGGCAVSVGVVHRLPTGTGVLARVGGADEDGVLGRREHGGGDAAAEEVAGVVGVDVVEVELERGGGRGGRAPRSRPVGQLRARREREWI